MLVFPVQNEELLVLPTRNSTKGLQKPQLLQEGSSHKRHTGSATELKGAGAEPSGLPG